MSNILNSDIEFEMNVRISHTICISVLIGKERFGKV